MSIIEHNQDEPSDCSIIVRKEVPIKVIRSCDRCKEKKIRCNNVIPCNQCTQHKAECTYNKPAKRRRYLYLETDTSHDLTAEAETKVQQLEEEILKYKIQIRALEKSLTQYVSPVIVIIQSIFTKN